MKGRWVVTFTIVVDNPTPEGAAQEARDYMRQSMHDIPAQVREHGRPEQSVMTHPTEEES